MIEKNICARFWILVSPLSVIIALSSNGKRADSDSVNQGSSPWRASKIFDISCRMIYIIEIIPRSFNGRTAGFEPANGGSNPSRGSK